MRDTSFDLIKTTILEALDWIEQAINADNVSESQQMQVQLIQLEREFETSQHDSKAKGTPPLADELIELAEQKRKLEDKVQQAKEIGVEELQLEINNLKMGLDQLGQLDDLKNIHDTLQAILSEINPIISSTRSAEQDIILFQEKLQFLQTEMIKMATEQERLDSELAKFEQKREIHQLRDLCLEKAKQTQSIESALRQHIGIIGGK